MPSVVAARRSSSATPVATVRGADLLVQMLAEAGVEIVFGLPGGAISPVHDALLDSEHPRDHDAPRERRDVRGRRLRARDRQARRGRGDVGARRAQRDDRPGVGVVRRPAGAAARRRGAARRCTARACCRTARRTACRSSRWRATSPSSRPRCRGRARCPHLLRRAIATALSGRRGPVVLTLPLDVTTAQVARAARRRRDHHPRHGRARDRSTRSTELLRDAERPLILAGSGVRGGDAPARSAHASPSGCPARSRPRPRARACSPRTTRSRSACSASAVIARRSATSRRGVDVVVAIGTSLGDIATDGFSPHLQARARSIHVDIDAAPDRQELRADPRDRRVRGRVPRRRSPSALGDRCRAQVGSAARLPGGVERHVLASSTQPQSDRVARRGRRDPGGAAAPTRSTRSTPASTSCSRCTTSRSTRPTRSW